MYTCIRFSALFMYFCIEKEKKLIFTVFQKLYIIIGHVVNIILFSGENAISPS